MSFDTIIPYAAAADLSSKQYHCVKDNGSGAAAAFAANTDYPVGILQNAPDAAGESCTLKFDGVSKVKLGGTVAKGDLIGPDAAGKLVKRTPGTDEDKYIIGRAGAAGVLNDVIPAALLPVPVPAAGSGAGSVSFAEADAFVSTEQTGTGSSQNVAHGLGAAPNAVLVVPTDTAPATAGDYTAVEGTHTSTNVVVTVTSGKKFKVFAWV